MVIGQPRDEDLVALDEALAALAEVDARKAQVVELRFFGGLTEEETAEALRRFPGNGQARLADGQFLAAAQTGRRSRVMNPERWAQIEQLYHAALEREPAVARGVPRRSLRGR